MRDESPFFQRASVPIAKERLKVLVVSDRMKCMPEHMERLTRELYQTVSRHIEIREDSFRITMDETGIHLLFTKIQRS